MKKILLIQEGSADEYGIKRLKEETQLLGHNFNQIKHSDLNFQFSDGYKVIDKNTGEDVIENYDYFLFRSAKDYKTGIRFNHFTYTVKYLANQKGKYSLNFENSFTHYHNQTKIYNYAVLSSYGLPIIKTWVYATLDDVKNNDDFQFPLICKPAQESQGRGVELIKSLDELIRYCENSKFPVCELVFQEYIQPYSETPEDIRILALGDRILGGMKRISNHGKVTTNYSTGGSVINYELDSELQQIVIKIMKIFNLDYCGVDIIFDNGQPKILEINNSAQFKGFEESTGVNVAKSIIEYILSK
ncbi:RimK family alpha-L-glutamate ligase [Candidatus Dojkabacteria bacterium]|uniref:RimK family alpha-L-glutamate ligase n=1 Tax=Candidatus Dojkabacteria bacterium TaxID=2099670 RepID=A0A955L9P0_9BACT|nr:RimK family alpha-L-glutamate ligase [Candidatus Dojkabacteria bacterium]